MKKLSVVSVVAYIVSHKFNKESIQKIAQKPGTLPVPLNWKKTTKQDPKTVDLIKIFYM